MYANVNVFSWSHHQSLIWRMWISLTHANQKHAHTHYDTYTFARLIETVTYIKILSKLHWLCMPFLKWTPIAQLWLCECFASNHTPLRRIFKFNNISGCLAERFERAQFKWCIWFSQRKYARCTLEYSRC